MLREVVLATWNSQRAALLLVLSLGVPTLLHGRELSFEDRVEAQAAIERVYYSHQIGTTVPFEVAVPREGIEKRVRAYLEQGAALEADGKTGITEALLDRELKRMLRDTRLPARLKEIFAALHDDPFVIRECLARPIVVRRWSAGDPASDDLGPLRSVRTQGPLGPPETQWRESEPAAQRVCVPDDTWADVALANAPEARSAHKAVWTGSVMVVWGGYSTPFLVGPLATGGRYDPATDTWTATSTVGAPAARAFHSAVWTGSRVVIWGGYYHSAGTDHYLDTGGRYDPATDTWTATSTVAAPPGRSSNTAVWTGNAMVVWGGTALEAVNTGGRYDPVADNWMTLSTVGAPSARHGHRALWTGSKMLVWGGIGDTSANLENTGGQYDPVNDTWSATATVGAPTARIQHTAVWTGTAMLVWGGSGSGELDTGGRYDPVTNVWTPISTTGAPSARGHHTAIWTGHTMVIWGGASRSAAFDPVSGGRYDPVTNTWTATSTSGAPGGRTAYTAIWTGSVMVVWGGTQDSVNLDTGGSYAVGPSLDDDGDGLSECQGDCDDADPSIHPGAIELCNGSDDDCDGGVDDGNGALCNDLDPCSADSCHGASGCSHSPAPGAACEDGNPCTIDDRCNQPGLCVGGSQRNCQDQNPCTADACSATTGCIHSPVSCSSIDFAPPASAVPAGFVKDDGSVFSPTLGFGWSASVPSRARNSAQPLELDTFVFSNGERTWTVELPNGNYEVCLRSGDASFPQGPHRIAANGIPLIDDVMTAANQFASSCPPGATMRLVPVRTGRLGVTIGGTSGSTMLNVLATAPVTGGSPPFWSVDFQPAGSSPAPGFVIDSGQTFTAARGYGWDATMPSRDRNRSVPQLLDTFVFSSSVRTWELSVPNGEYDVWYGAGDAEFAQGPHRLEVEGVLVIQNVPTAAGSFLEGSTQSHVADGRLTVRIGQGTGPWTTLNYLVIAPTDTDSDSLPDAQDDCPQAYDPGQEDGDFDGVGFACDHCPHDHDPSQADADHDGVGDVCDLDDGVIFQFAPSRTRIAWQPEVGVTSWNVYEGDLEVLKATGEYTQEPDSNPLAKRHCEVLSTWVDEPVDPQVGNAAFSLVSGVQNGVEGDLGRDSEGVERLRTRACP